MAKLQVLPHLLLWIGPRSKQHLSSNQGPSLLFLSRGLQFPVNGWDSSDTPITSSLRNRGSLCPLGAPKPAPTAPGGSRGSRVQPHVSCRVRGAPWAVSTCK